VISPRIIAALCALAVWASSLALVGFKSYGLGVDHSKAKQADIEAARQQARDDAQTGAANAIAKAAAENTKVETHIKTITREVPVYRDGNCAHDQRVFDGLNRALRGEPAGGGLVPPGSGSLTGQADGVEH
jgi:hypothetical protein